MDNTLLFDPFQPVPANEYQQEIRRLTLRQSRLRIMTIWSIVVWGSSFGWTVHFLWLGY